MVLLVEGGLLLLAWPLGGFLGVGLFDRLSFTPRFLLWGALFTLPSLVLVPWSMRTSWAPFARLRQEMQERFRVLFGDLSYFQIFTISILAGIGEEVFFRGVVQRGLAGFVGPWVALALASLLFGLAHPVSPLYVALAALVGLVMGGLMMAFDDLTVPIVTHALHDVVALLALKRAGRPASDAAGGSAGSAA